MPIGRDFGAWAMVEDGEGAGGAISVRWHNGRLRGRTEKLILRTVEQGFNRRGAVMRRENEVHENNG